MPRKHRLIGVAAVVVAALAAPAALVWRVLPPHTSTEFVFSGGATTPVALERTASGMQQLAFETPRFPRVRGTRVAITVGSDLRKPSETIQLVLLGPRGASLGRCRIPPTDYAATGYVACPIARPELLRRIRISSSGSAPLTVYLGTDRSKRVGGSLTRERRLATFGARLREANARLAVTRPRLLPPALLFVLLAASIAFFGVVCLLLLEFAWSRAERVRVGART